MIAFVELLQFRRDLVSVGQIAGMKFEIRGADTEEALLEEFFDQTAAAEIDTATGQFAYGYRKIRVTIQYTAD